jgi:hypothetical protein
VSLTGTIGNVATLVKYWSKGRFTRTTFLAITLGEIALSIFLLFAGGTFLSFSSRFGASGGAQITEASWGLVLGFYLVGLVQSGFYGAGLPFVSADVDYVFTSPVKTTEVFTAKILLNSVTALLAFPPIFFLYLRATYFYGTPAITALIAGIVTLVFFFMGLLFSADITLALRSDLGRRMSIAKYLLTGFILAASLIPLLLLIPGAQSLTLLSEIIRVLPSGTVANITVGLVSGVGGSYVLDLIILLAWLAGFSVIGIRMSRRQFYEMVQIPDAVGLESAELSNKKVVSSLHPEGKSVAAIVRAKERILMTRTKEFRSLLFSALILSVFMVIYSLAGTFTSSPTSFLFILFIIGSFGSGNAFSWIGKERLWILKTSSLSLRSYVKNVYLARIVPLLLFLTPALGVAAFLLLPPNLGRPETLLSIVLALISSIEIAAITMGGSMNFAARYAQSSADDLLGEQAQTMTNLKRMIFQFITNLLMVGPLMLLVLAAGWLSGALGIISLGVLLSLAGLGYSFLILNYVLNSTGNVIRKREDL